MILVICFNCSKSNIENVISINGTKMGHMKILFLSNRGYKSNHNENTGLFLHRQHGTDVKHLFYIFNIQNIYDVIIRKNKC